MIIMKGFRPIMNIVLVVILLGCQSKDQISDDFLVGRWYTSDISSSKKLFFDTEKLAESNNLENFEFTADKILYMYRENKIIDSCSYQFSIDDSTLTMNDNGKIETSSLNIISQDEFELEDNMGLILKLKRNE